MDKEKEKGSEPPEQIKDIMWIIDNCQKNKALCFIFIFLSLWSFDENYLDNKILKKILSFFSEPAVCEKGYNHLSGAIVNYTSKNIDYRKLKISYRGDVSKRCSGIVEIKSIENDIFIQEVKGCKVNESVTFFIGGDKQKYEFRSRYQAKVCSDSIKLNIYEK